MGQLIDNGLIHLMVVSGLHIGIMATLGFWLGSVIGRALSALGSAVPATVSASLCSLMLASLYAALSGFGLPAQRALVMVGVVLWALLWRRPVRGGAVFTMALAGVALVDPAAVLRMGFWLSFAAVGALLFYFAPRPATSKSLALIVAQPVVFAGLAPWLLFFQGRVNLLMMPFNLLFIPWISFVVTPLCLLGAIFQPVPEIGDVLWQLARWQLSYFDQLLGQISSLDAGGESWWYLYAPAHSYTVLTVALLATMPILLLPSGSGLALCGVLLTVVLLVADPAPEESTLLVTVLDVGQGTAVVVRAGEKTLVYDTGAGFSDSFDAGSGIIAPYLASKGVRSVDTLVISHNDGDHSGGARGLLSTVRVQEIFTSDPGISKDWGLSSRACRRGQSWQWQSVEFRFLWPESLSSNDNNNSCVLLITLNPQQAPGVSILLPGDIEASVERLLVSLDDLDWTTVVIAPHHGQ
jgi:DNA internalization-related competence protein ComEC/Rec2